MNLLSKLLRNNSFFNVSKGHVSMFDIEDGETIEKGDYVVVNSETLLARKPINSNGYFTAGVAIRVIELKNGKQSVICVDGCHLLYDPNNIIQENDIGKECYFLNENAVTTNPTNKTKAGIVMNIELSDDPNDIADDTDRIIWIKTDLLTEVV